MDRSEALRLKGPAVETIKLDAEIDATDDMEAGDRTVGKPDISTARGPRKRCCIPARDN